jgi:hypothetical protein
MLRTSAKLDQSFFLPLDVHVSLILNDTQLHAVLSINGVFIVKKHNKDQAIDAVMQSTFF